jgi:hypothetical protein
MLETWTRHTVSLIIIESQKYGQSPPDLVRYQTTLSTECHVIHITKYGLLPLCVLSYQATLYNNAVLFHA